MALQGTFDIRVRYSETDQMGTFYNSRALEWFECARTEVLRQAAVSYVEFERRGVFLPLVEAHVNYRGRARYDDLLQATVEVTMHGRASVRFDVRIVHADTGNAVCDGYTIHAIIDAAGKPIRPPAWVLELLNGYHS